MDKEQLCCAEKAQWLQTSMAQKANKLKDNLFQIGECLYEARKITGVCRNLTSWQNSQSTPPVENTIKQVNFDMGELIELSSMLIEDFHDFVGELK